MGGLGWCDEKVPAAVHSEMAGKSTAGKEANGVERVEEATNRLTGWAGGLHAPTQDDFKLVAVSD